MATVAIENRPATPVNRSLDARRFATAPLFEYYLMTRSADLRMDEG